MKYETDKKEATRQRILEAAHRGFRRRGYAGAGVDGLAQDASVTSGAFYKHFDSKGTAFRESVALGIREFQAAVELYIKEYGDLWLDEFTNFYLGEKRNCELGDSCGLQSLTPEVARSNDSTRTVFQSELQNAAKSFAAGLPLLKGKPDSDRAWASIALLIGGVTLARAVKDQELADEIVDAVRSASELQNLRS